MCPTVCRRLMLARKVTFRMRWRQPTQIHGEFTNGREAASIRSVDDEEFESEST